MRDVVDRSWAAFFGVAATELRAAGVRVVTDAPALADYRGIYLLRLGDGCTIGAPPDVAATVAERAAGRDADGVYTRDRSERLVPAGAASLVLGPSRHAYVDADAFIPASGCEARRLGPRDADAVARFRADVDEGEWTEGGFGHGFEGSDPTWGAFENGRLVAMGNMTDFDGAPADVGLVTHPAARGRGVGTMLASAMVSDALATTPVVRYRALESNVASLRVADRLGFVPDGGNIAVRLRA